MIRSIWLVIAFLFLSVPARAQDLSETLGQVAEVYARAYVDRVPEVLGAHLNTGLFHTAGTSSKVFGVDVYIGVKGSASLLDNSYQTFDLVYQRYIPLEVELAGQTVTMNVPATFTVDNVPSVFGEDEIGIASVSVDHDTTFSTLGLTLPVSFDSTLTPQETISGKGPIEVFPFAVPQIGLGTIFGTDVMIRWLPKFTVPDAGSVELFGFGIRHNLSQYLPALPFDVSIQTAWQRLRLEGDTENESIEAHTFAVNVALSKRIGILTVYGGLQTERSDVDFSYFQVEGDNTIDVDFTLRHTGQNRGIFGFGLKLGPVVWNADVSVSNLIVYSTGFGLAF